MGKFNDLTGQKFGRWTVLREAGRDKYNNVTWLCRCDCGTEREIISGSLVTGSSKSCGCIRKEKMDIIIEKLKKDNALYKQKLYTKWKNLKARAKGHVCEAWRRSYFSFRDWALGSGYTEGKRIKRVDKEYPYRPDNCVWM